MIMNYLIILLNVILYDQRFSSLQLVRASSKADPKLLYELCFFSFRLYALGSSLKAYNYFYSLNLELLCERTFLFVIVLSMS